jgi:glycosyltransferase involved in cell wall biosynthesis
MTAVGRDDSQASWNADRGDMKSLTSENLTSTQLHPSARLPRVLHVGKFYPPHMGGIETHLRDLCNQLCHSVDLRVIVANESRFETSEVLDGVPVLRVPTWATLASTPICPALIRAIRTFDDGIVHLHVPNPMSILAYLLSDHKGPLVVTYHSDMVRQKFLGTMFAPFLHWTLRRASAIIATSPNYIESSPVLVQYRNKCHVIPLGIPLENFQQPELAAVAALREKYGSRVIVSVGRLVYYKGFQHLIRAMSRVRGHLLIVGAGPLHAELTALAAELGISDRVHVLGKLGHQELVNCYHAAQVFTLASVARSEAFGISQIEAMAAGLPVVNTQLDSGVPFVSLHERTGLTVPCADPDALASAINALFDNDDLRTSYGRAARRRAHDEFSAEAMAARTLALYRDIVSRPADLDAGRSKPANVPPARVQATR